MEAQTYLEDCHQIIIVGDLMDDKNHTTDESQEEEHYLFAQKVIASWPEWKRKITEEVIRLATSRS